MRNFEYSAYPMATLIEPVQQIDYFTNTGSGGYSSEYSNSYTMTVYNAPPSLYPQSVEYGQSAVFTPMEYSPTYQPPLFVPIQVETLYRPMPLGGDYGFYSGQAAPINAPMEQTYTTSYEPTPIYKSQPSYSEPLELIRPTFVDDVVTPIFEPIQLEPYERQYRPLGVVDENGLISYGGLRPDRNINEIISSGGFYDQAAPVDAMMEQTTPIIYSDARDVLPFIPDWNNLDCEQFDTQLNSLKYIIRETRFTDVVYNQIQQAINEGEKVKAIKCVPQAITIPTPTPTPTPIPTPTPTPNKKVEIPLIIESDGTLVDSSTNGGTGTGTFVDDKAQGSGTGTGGTFVDDKATTQTQTQTQTQTTKLPTASVSKNLKPYVFALGGIVAILVVSRILSKKS